MGTCNIDHSHEDVVKKWKSQEEYMPVVLNEKVQHFLDNELSQETLNELFHLLKKYDLSSKSEREDRNKKMVSLIG